MTDIRIFNLEFSTETDRRTRPLKCTDGHELQNGILGPSLFHTQRLRNSLKKDPCKPLWRSGIDSAIPCGRLLMICVCPNSHVHHRMAALEPVILVYIPSKFQTPSVPRPTPHLVLRSLAMWLSQNLLPLAVAPQLRYSSSCARSHHAVFQTLELVN